MCISYNNYFLLKNFVNQIPNFYIFLQVTIHNQEKIN